MKQEGKIKVKMVLVIIIGIICSAFAIAILRNAIIIASLSNKAKQYSDCDNYYARWATYSGVQLNVFEAYYKDNQYIEEVYGYDIDRRDGELVIPKTLIYYDGNGKTMEYFTNEKKVMVKEIEEDDTFTHPTISPQSMSRLADFTDNLGTFIKYCFITQITSEKCNNKDCYKFVYQNDTNRASYIDKETGLIIRGTDVITIDDEDFDITVDTTFKFNCVTDADITPPSTDGYEIKVVEK